MTKWQVLTWTVCDGWINTWHEDDKPWLFDSEAEAWAELEDFANEMEIDFEDYRVEPYEPTRAL